MRWRKKVLRTDRSSKGKFKDAGEFLLGKVKIQCRDRKFRNTKSIML